MLAPAANTALLAGAVIDTVGGALTFTVAAAWPPLAETRIVVLPEARPLTGSATLVCPEAKATEAGAAAIAGLALVTASEPAAVGAGESVALSVPGALPAMTASGLGASDTGLGITRVKTDTVRVVPVAPATCTASVLLAASVATRSTVVAPPEKSDKPKTCVPFSFTDSAVRLLGAESCMRTTYDPAPELMLKLREKEKLCVEGSVAENGPASRVPALCARAPPAARRRSAPATQRARLIAPPPPECRPGR